MAVAPGGWPAPAPPQGAGPGRPLGRGADPLGRRPGRVRITILAAVLAVAACNSTGGRHGAARWVRVRNTGARRPAPAEADEERSWSFRIGSPAAWWRRLVARFRRAPAPSAATGRTASAEALSPIRQSYRSVLAVLARRGEGRQATRRCARSNAGWPTTGRSRPTSWPPLRPLRAGPLLVAAARPRPSPAGPGSARDLVAQLHPASSRRRADDRRCCAPLGALRLRAAGEGRATIPRHREGRF